MAEGGWNLVWCGEKDLDTVHRHGLRGQLQDSLYLFEVMDNNGNGEIYPDLETETPYIVVKLRR